MRIFLDDLENVYADTLMSDIPSLVFNDILGTPNRDFLFGTKEADSIDGLTGNDILFGLAGSDRINGGQGQDKLFGNSGNDTLDGGADQDSLWGGSGHDLVFGGAGNDRLSGNWGNDFLSGDEGTDLILGNAGDDTLDGGDDHDSLLGGRGADILYGGNGDDWIFGGLGNDVFVASPGADTIVGGSGDDTVQYQGSLNDFIFKGAPDRFQVVGANGTHTLKEIEYLDFSGQQVSVDTLSYLPAPLFSKIEQIETVIPSSGDEVDIFIPVGPSSPSAKSLPVALFLQGANVDKSNYEEYAKVVASYGFVVVVPNNFNTFTPPPPAPPITGYFSELQQINEVLDFIQDPVASPAAELVNPEQLVLLGHSIGGQAGLNAVQGGCTDPCPFGEFEQPEELVGAAFYGTNLRNFFDGSFSPIDNGTIPTALILGENDGRALPVNTVATYEQIVNPPKALVSVAGANHFGITDINTPNNPASTPTDVPPIIQDPIAQTIPQHISIDTIGTWSALFLRATVLADPVAIDFVFSGAGDQIDTNVDVITENPSNLFIPSQAINMGFSGELFESPPFTMSA